MSRESLSAVQEDYLEAILALEARGERVRARDLAERLAVHKSTVTASLKALAERGLIEYEPYGQIVMTPAGRQAGERVTATHTLVKAFLTDVLMIDADTAEANACRMEHVMDRAVLKRLARFADFMEGSTTDGADCKTRFAKFLAAKGA